MYTFPKTDDSNAAASAVRNSACVSKSRVHDRRVFVSFRFRSYGALHVMWQSRAKQYSALCIGFNACVHKT